MRPLWLRRLPWAAAAVIPLVFLGVFFAWPVLSLVGRGFVADGALDLGGFGDVFARPRTWRIIGMTLLQAGLGTALSVLLGIPGAYVLYRRATRGAAWMRALVTVPFVLPTVVVGVMFRALLGPGGPLEALGWHEGLGAIVAAFVFFNFAVVVRTVGATWQGLDVRVEQAARALGASPWRAFRTVTLPALGPAVTAAASLVFLFCATSFGTVLVLGGLRYGTIETEIYLLTTQFLDLRSAAVLSVVQLLVVVAVLVVADRARARRERALVLSPPRPGEVSDGRLRASSGGGSWVDRAAVAITGCVLALLALPVLNLLVRSLRTRDGWGLGNYVALGTGEGLGVTGALQVTVWQAVGTSLRTAAIATALALLVGGAVALLVSRRPRSRIGRRSVAVLDAAFMLPLGVSAVTVGFGFLITLDRPLGLPVDLRTAGLLVPIAQAVVAVPLVVRTVLPVLRALDPRQREVAATLGAGPGRVLRTLDARVALRPLALALGLAFAASMGEFGATSFLARPDSATLPVVVYRLIGSPGQDAYGMALAASVVLAACTAGVMALAELLRDRRTPAEL